MPPRVSEQQRGGTGCGEALGGLLGDSRWVRYMRDTTLQYGTIDTLTCPAVNRPRDPVLIRDPSDSNMSGRLACMCALHSCDQVCGDHVKIA